MKTVSNFYLFALVALIAASMSFIAVPQRIAVLSDIHVTPGNAADSVLRAAVREINADDFDLVVVNGDLSNEGSDAELYNVKKILDEIRHPMAVLPGNHENNWRQSATKAFVDLWGDDRFVTEIGDIVIVGINCGPYMAMGDGHIKQEDLRWLRSTLDERVTDGKRVLSFNHYPLQDDIDNYIDYINLLSEYPVIGHINGHYHTWRQYMGGTIPSVMTRALAMEGDGDGYAILDITPDWMHVYNKRLGVPAEPKYAWIARPHELSFVKRADLNTGNPEGFAIKRVWVDSASIFTRLAFDVERIYFGNSLGQVKAISKSDSALVWQYATGASLFSRPVVLKKGNVAVPYFSGIVVLEPVTGRFVRNFISREGPYVADGLLTGNAYVQGGYKRMERRNPVTGKLVWTYDSILNYCQAAPVVAGDDLVFGAWDTNLRSLNLKTGKLNWAWNNGKSANMLGPGNVVPVVTCDKVIIVAPDRYMTALDRQTGRQLWRDNSHRYRESLGHSEDMTRVYAKTMDGELVAVDAASPDFKELWVVDMGIGYDHAPCIVLEKDGVVYAGSRRGIVTAVDPIAHAVIWSKMIGTSSINGFDVDPTTGDVYVSLIEGAIFKITKN